LFLRKQNWYFFAGDDANLIGSPRLAPQVRSIARQQI
jgi:hypothetical protein